MNGLLPEIVRHAVASKSVFWASQSFGVVALVLLVVLLLEREALKVTRARRIGVAALTVGSLAMLVVVTATIIARLYATVQ